MTYVAELASYLADHYFHARADSGSRGGDVVASYPGAGMIVKLKRHVTLIMTGINMVIQF